ncbi:MAG: twin-arginine translocation signal domain-containing protein, partial [Betaproteobacteria bacterium]
MSHDLHNRSRRTALKTLAAGAAATAASPLW